MRKSFNRGNTSIIVLVIVIFAVLIYFNVDLRSIVDSFLQNPILQKLWVILKGAWVSYIMPLSIYLWDSITRLFN